MAKEKMNLKKVSIIGIAVFLVISIILGVLTILTKTNVETKKKNVVLDSELARAMTYEQFEEGDDDVYSTDGETKVDNVKFSAFFLRDLDGDGYAEKLKGTCRELGKQDTLYMEINVLTEGKLKNGKIQIGGENYYLQTTLPKDDELKNNYIGANIKVIEFNEIANGTQKMLFGLIRSGDYSRDTSKTSAIGNNINNYSRETSITLTGIYEAEDGTETEITKIIPLQIDWYGTATASINTRSQTYENLGSKINEEEGTVNITFSIYTEETKKELLVKSNHVEGTIPQLNGYDPIEVKCTSSNSNFNYNESTRTFTIDRESVVNTETGAITSGVSRSNSYGMSVKYPLEAYETLGEERIVLNIPVSTYYTCYNNPNTEFNNPYKTNTPKGNIIVYTQHARPKPPTPSIPTPEVVYPPSISITVGEYISSPTGRYVVSKRKPLKIYNEVSTEEKDDQYAVRWEIYTGTNGNATGAMLKEGKNGEIQKHDDFIKKDSNHESMEELTTTVGIGFSGVESFIKNSDGEIKIYDDETGILIATLSKTEAQKYTKSSPYKFNAPVKHVRVETSETNAKSTLYVYLIKELDDEYITNNYTREEFDNLQYIQSNLEAFLGENRLGPKANTALYQAPYSIATISISKNTMSTQATEEHDLITIATNANTNNNQVAWTDGEFLVKLPAEIIAIDINNITINNSQVKITSYELIEQEGSKFIKINTQNKRETPETYSIIIDCDITPDPRIPNTTKSIELYAVNKETEDYYYNAEDIYDVDDDLNTQEKVNKASCQISMIAPNSLLINQIASEFDDKNSVMVSPQVADIKPQYAVVDGEENTAKIGINLKNNYSSDISEIKLIGVIPFEGNKYAISNKEMGSTFTTKMTNEGLTIPEELEGKVTVYYSEQEHPGKDLDNESNGWVKAENVENWDNIKTFMVDFEDYILEASKTVLFEYTVSIPNGLEFNKLSYSEAGVYFSLHTEAGKYRTKTEPNKLGFRIAEKYKLELTKFQTGKEKLIAGATYLIIKEGDEEGKTATTDDEGKLQIKNLYAEETYSIQEIKTPEDYELNDEVIKFIGHVNSQTGELTIEKISGTTKNEITVTKQEGEDHVAHINVEDEAKATLKVTKVNSETSQPIRGVKYKLTGEGIRESGKVVTTNANGEATIKGIKIGSEYTLEETKAEGYYLNDPITFKIANEDGTYVTYIKENDQWVLRENSSIEYITETEITENDYIPTANITIKDDQIPTYDLKIKKLEAGTETTLAGAKFKLYKDNKEIGVYETDENGQVTITGLYQYEQDRNIDQTYKLVETFAPEGYAKTTDITFHAETKIEEKEIVDEETGETTTETITRLELVETIPENAEAHTYIVEENTIILNVEDKPAFKLIKKDGETNTLLPNTKFAIYNVEEGEVPARNSKNEIIGTKEIINGREYYVVVTDENGEIKADLPEGLYKAVEVEADEKYDISGNTEYFGIGKSREGKTINYTSWAKSIGESSSDCIYSVAETQDGGYLVGGSFSSSSSIDIGNGKQISSRGSSDGMLLKYNREGECEFGISIGGSSGDYITSVTETTDGGYLIGGNFYSSSIDLGNGKQISNHNSSYYDGMLIKYNNEGECEFGISIGGSHTDYINSVLETADGGYLVGGYFNSSSIDLENGKQISNHGSTSYSDGMLIKYSREGECEYGISIGGSSSDVIKSVTETTDGGYLIGGYFYSSSIDLGNGKSLNNKGSTDGMIIKYNKEGEFEFGISIGDNGYDYINSVAGTTDEGYLVGGYFSSSIIDLGNGKQISNHGSSDGMLIKYNKEGECEYGISIGGSDNDYINSVIKTKDAGYLVGGYFKSSSIDLGNGKQISNTGGSTKHFDGMVIKYNSECKCEWGMTIGQRNTKIINVSGIDDDEIISITEATAGEYLVGGYFKSRSLDFENRITIINHRSNSEVPDGMIIKIKEEEIPELNTKLGISIGGLSDDSIRSVTETTDGGVLVGGEFYSSSIDLGNGKKISNHGRTSTQDGMIIKYSREGECEFGISIGGSSNDYVNSIVETPDGGYLVGGYFESSSIDLGNGKQISNYDNSYNSYNGMIIKYNKEGECEFGISIGDNGYDYINSVAGTTDGGYLVGGYFNSSSINLGNGKFLNNKGSADGMLIKYNREGECEYGISIGGIYGDRIASVTETADGGFLVGGYFSSSNIDLGNGKQISNYGKDDGMIIKYNKEGKCEFGISIGGSRLECIESVTDTTDGGFLVGGYFYSSSIDLGNGKQINNHGSADYPDGMIIKYNREGECEFGISIGGSGSDVINSVTETSDEGYLVGGRFVSGSIYLGNGKQISNHNSSYYDGMLIKYNREGECEFGINIGGSMSDFIHSVIETDVGDYLAGGHFESSTAGLANLMQINNHGSTGSSDGMIIKVYAQTGVPEQEEVTVENYRKEYKITTDVKEIDNIKGGNISGEDSKAYEKVKHGDNSIKEIVMTPDENYEIIGITVNGEEWQYEELEDGSYIMPQFENMQEDKHIVVTYALKDNKIIINKTDSVSGEKLPGAEFKLVQIEERENPDNSSIIGSLFENGQEYNYIDYDNEESNLLGELTNNNTYYFVENESGSLVPTNSKTWQVANVEGATTGIQNVTANSYIPIDLSEVAGEYRVVVNAQVSSQSSYDYGYATITQTTTAPIYSNSTGRFIQISGTSTTYTTPKDYESSMVLEGGNTYYLHLGYRKNNGTDTGDDQFAVNSIRLYKNISEVYNFVEQDGKYESTNQGKNNTVANSYIPIDLQGYSGKYNLTVNAEVSTQSGDYGYVTVTENTTRPSSSTTAGRIIYITGINSAEGTIELQGGKQYYLHLGYLKNGTANTTGEDKFIVNSINISLSDSELYHTTVETNSEGQAITQIPFGKYKVTEIKTPEEYITNENIPNIEFRSYDGAQHEFTITNEKLAHVTVHHYIKGTETKLVDDEVVEGRIDEDYKTLPATDTGRYELEISETGEEILPDNMNGKFTYEDQVVTYYYVPRAIPLTVHHYIEGTTDQVPLKNGEVAEDVTDSGMENEEYTTQAISNDLLDDEYELVEIPENATGTYQYDEVIVTYYYKKVEREVTLNKYEKDGQTPLANVKFKIGDKEYTTNSNGKIIASLGAGEYEVKEVEAPEGYELNPETQSITITRETENEVLNITNEKKKGTVIVHHYIEGTTTPVKLADGSDATDESKSDYVGEIYATKALENISDRFDLVSDDVPNGSGEFIDGTIEVTYYYRPVPTSVIVHHYIEGTTTPVPMADGSEAQDEIIEGFVEDEYSTSQKNGISNKYGLVEVPENSTGNITRDPIEVTYYYRLKDTTVLVHHYIENTTTKLSEDVLIGGRVDDEYHTVVAGDIPSKYVLVEEPSNKDGLMEVEQVVVTYYYRLKDTSVLVHHYIEKTTTKLSEDVLIEGRVDDEYSTVIAKDIPVYYELVEEPENKNGTMVEEQTVVTYYYKLKNYPYVVNYLEKGSNTVLHEQKDGEEHVWGTEIQSSEEIIDIDGYNYDSVDKDTLTITENENVINIYYTKRNDLSYKVNYLELGTDKVLHEQKTQGNMTFKDVVTSSEEIIDIDGYNYNSVDKESITIVTNEAENVINIYYTKRGDLSYKVNYLELGTDKVLHEQKTQGEKAFEDVVVSSHEVIDIDGYSYNSVDKESITIVTNEAENVINIYYTKRNDLSYKVNYLELGTDKVIHEQKTQGNMTFEEVVTSATEVIDIYGYNYDSADKESIEIGTNEAENVINLYYTKKDTKVTVHYYEEGTENKLSEDKEIPGKVFDPYQTESANDVPSKYELVEEPANKEGEMTEEEIIVIYYYRKKGTQVIVHHYEEGTTNKLSENETIEGKVDDEYETEPAKDIPAKYELCTDLLPENATGEMAENIIHVIYYYRVRDSYINVRFLEKGTNIELAEDERQEGKVDEPYQTMAKEFEGYTLVEHSGNENGKFEVEPLTIIYYYLQNTKATVQYIDKTTGEILEQSTETGLVGDIFETDSKNFDGYILVEEPEEKSVAMEKDEIVLKYYYEHVSAGVIEKHIDEITGEVLANEVHEGSEGEPYAIESREFEGYDLVEDRLPENAEGTMSREVIEVVYYYSHRAKVTAEYIDLSTGEKMCEDEKQEGHAGETYTTERKKFDGYVLVGVPENADGKMTKEEITVKYYYKKISGGVVINHIDVATQKQLVDEEKQEGYVGENYDTEPKNIEGYKLVKEKYPTNAEGKFKEETIYVTYYYESPAKLIVNYYDIDTKEKLTEPMVTEGYRGDKYTTEEKKFEYYKLVDVEGEKAGIMDGEKVVNYKYRKMNFNLKVDKIIDKVIVNGKETKVNSELGKVEVHRKNLQKDKIQVVYKIIITNDSEITGKATVIENIPENMKMRQENNKTWTIGNTQATQETIELKPGEKQEIQVVMDWINGEEATGTMVNTVELIGVSNKAEFKELREEDNKSGAEVIIAIGTGDSTYIAITAGLMMILIGAGIVIWNKKK